tara:strand:- start:162143 stop:162817 length:675 start_codon:yes stop_codon:yes gene_type:complete
MSLLVVSLYNIHLGSKQEEEYEIELSLVEEDMIEEEMEKEPLEESEKPGQSKSNLAYNETAKPSVGSPEPLQTLEELMEEQETASNSEEDTDYLSSDTGYGASLKKLAKQRQEAKQKIGELEAKKEAPTSFSKRNTTVSYSLIDRTHYDLPIPVYTCIEGGKIVINIIVNSSGNVTEATVNRKSSNTLNGCLVDNAITYALKARFDNASRNDQRGTITYLFQGK